MRIRSRNTMIVWLVLLALASIAGCSDNDPGQPEAQAPALPPASSMQFDLSFFEETEAGRVAEMGPEATSARGTYFHWLNAVVRVAYVNLAVAEAFHGPALAFALAVHTVPTQQPDGSWLWIYTWADGTGHEVQVRLRGKVAGDHVEWELRVTDNEAEPPLDQALWFRGESSLVSESGFWVFYLVEDGQEVELARIDWNVESAQQRELTVQNIHEGSPELGDALSYLVEGSIVTISFVDATPSGGIDYSGEISWNEATGAGYLDVPDYNNGQRACWDENQMDIECEPI